MKNSANWNTAFQGGKNVTTSWIVLISDDGAVSEAFGKTLSAGRLIGLKFQFAEWINCTLISEIRRRYGKGIAFLSQFSRT